MPILHAPILEQAGFSIGSTEPEPVINYVARLDGISQRWSFSDVRTLEGDFEVAFDVLMDGTPPLVLMGGANRFGCIFFNEGKFNFRDINDVTRTTVNTFSSAGDTVYSVRVLISSGVISVSIDGVDQPLSGNTSNFTGLYLRYLAVRDSDNFYLKGYIKSFELIESGVKTIAIPLTNKAQGATQLATVGSVNATMVNYTEDVWEEI